ncbi:MAG: hypothetical protein ABGX07_15885 [Pirellulaceae bacterium]
MFTRLRFVLVLPARPDFLNDNRKLCSMYLSIMDRMGVTLDRFGDADQRLSGL